jgi:hypothetical protein
MKYHLGQYTPEYVDHVFVFGSNLAGRHGAGAAKYAMDYLSAQYGTGLGLTGHAYALPTKDYDINTLPIRAVEYFIRGFMKVAASTNKKYFVTALGTGLAGFTHADIAPIFKGAPTNCVFPIEWKEYLE